MSDHDKTDDDANKEATDANIKVDDDWKDQVASEKSMSDSVDDESQDVQESNQTPSDTDDTSTAPTASAMPDPPPASFSVLVTMLFTQAMGMLGQMPDPNTGKTNVNKPFAKHYIDTLEMLESKTMGNLDDQEKSMLNEALHALRMMYVDTRE
jgi:hypothetical protein